MKRFNIAVIFIFAIVCISANGIKGQTLNIESKKTQFTRTGDDVPDLRKEFEITEPVIIDGTTPRAIENITKTLSFWNAFDMDMDDVLRDDTWLEEAYYDINYNQHNILSISLIVVGSAAYPSQAIKHFTFDINTGDKVEYADIFIESKMPELLTAIRTEMKRREQNLDAEEKDHLIRLRKEEAEFNPTPDKIGFEKLEEFYITENGVVFVYNYGYRHVEKALEPDGRILMTFTKIKPFIKLDGLLQPLVR